MVEYNKCRVLTVIYMSLLTKYNMYIMSSAILCHFLVS